jgi:CheY-like chemotaxis protein
MVINALQSLSSKKIQITEANNGQMAVDLVKDLLKTNHRSYDIIIMDFNMPVLNGQEATHAIRILENKMSSIKKSFIITWSTVKTQPYLGADAVLTKSIPPEELYNLLRNASL